MIPGKPRQGGRTAKETGGSTALGLYIHVPFCGRKCRYCDFYSVSGEQEIIRVTLEAFEGEMEMRARELSRPDIAIETIYIGGGTPSLLSPDEVRGLLRAARRIFPQGSRSEVTIEVNPRDRDRGWFEDVRSAGINRVSIGAQSLRDEDLGCLGRPHSARDARLAYIHARDAGFTDVSLDLIYGIPTQTAGTWKEILGEVVSLGPDHVSAYELSAPPGTELSDAVERGAVLLPGEEDIEVMFHLAGEVLGEGGLERYEVSNYARPGRESRHNLNYWHGGEYLGIGPSAHSHIGGRRFWNPRDLEAYVQRVKSGLDPTEGAENISPEAARRERILLLLRTRQGVSLDDLAGGDERVLSRLTESGLARVVSGRFQLTPRGLLVADEVALQVA